MRGLLRWAPGAVTALALAAQAQAALTVEQASLGPSGGNGAFDAQVKVASADGRRVVFRTAEKLTSNDNDSVEDLYDRFNGTTTLLTPGTSNPVDLATAFRPGATPDATHVYFNSTEPLAGGDSGTSPD